jgi:hypothetical protein
MSVNFGSSGKTHSEDPLPLTCPVIWCSAFWLTGFRADQLGDLDSESQRLLDRSLSPEDAGHRAVDLGRQNADLRPGTVLGREWYGHMHRVTVLTNGFSWNGKIYPSLSKAAFAITGTRWNGPKFFGLRAKQSNEPHDEGRIEQAGSLRDLYPRVDRAGPRPGLQLAGRSV